MSLRQYLFIMSLATAFCWLSWIIVLMTLDPFTSNAAGFAFFYASLFLSLLGTLSLAAFFLLPLRSSASLALFQRVKVSFLAGSALSGIITGLVVLQGNNMLVRWNTAVFFLMLAFFFFFFRSLKKRENTPFHSA